MAWSVGYRGWLLLVTLLSVCAATRAAELLPADKPIPEVVDHYVREKLSRANVEPAKQAEEGILVRRTMLDLVGRAPSAGEVRAYLDSVEPDKRTKLVDRLMASPAFARYLAYELDLMLSSPKNSSSMKDYLQTATSENRRWDQVFRELLQTEGGEKTPKGAEVFLKDRVSDVDRMTNEVSVLFFGVNVSCAMCHDHPLVSDWKQDHFYGMKSFLVRTYEAGNGVGEKAYGGINFKTKAGEAKDAKLMFLTGLVVEEPEWKEPSDAEKKKEKEELEQLKKDKKLPPPPAFSRRAKLVEIALSEGQRDFFARNMVNRVWARLFGRGMVDPLDQVHSENPPSHPDLLDWLARDFAAHGYDLQRLIRGLVLTEAYARSSRWEGEKRPDADLFAVAIARPLTPMQYAMALKMATAASASLPPLEKAEEWTKLVDQTEASARGLASMVDVPVYGEFQVSANEALLMSNSSRIDSELLNESKDRIVGHVAAIDDDAAAADAAVWNILTRPATEEETKVLAEYLGKRRERRPQAIKQMVWALLMSSEMRFNQ
jgi:hypothetical protein